MKIQFVPRDLIGLTNEQMALEIHKIAQEFPLSGDNYRIPILQEAIRRLEEEDRLQNE